MPFSAPNVVGISAASSTRSRSARARGAASRLRDVSRAVFARSSGSGLAMGSPWRSAAAGGAKRRIRYAPIAGSSSWCTAKEGYSSSTRKAPCSDNPRGREIPKPGDGVSGMPRRIRGLPLESPDGTWQEPRRASLAACGFDRSAGPERSAIPPGWGVVQPGCIAGRSRSGRDGGPGYPAPIPLDSGTPRDCVYRPLAACGETHVSAEAGEAQFLPVGPVLPVGARLTRRVREEPPPGELARVYFDRNATQNAAKRSGSAGAPTGRTGDRRTSPHRENWAAWVLPQAANPRASAARQRRFPALNAGRIRP